MSDEAAWKEMWERKDDGREMFCQAELLEDHEFQKWNGHGAKPEFTTYTKKAGSKVLITCVSRFGHACIRGTHVDQEVHGYDSGIAPEKLRNLRFLSDGGRPWRKEMFQKMGMWDSKPEPEAQTAPVACSGSTQVPCPPDATLRTKKKSKRSKS